MYRVYMYTSQKGTLQCVFTRFLLIELHVFPKTYISCIYIYVYMKTYISCICIIHDNIYITCICIRIHDNVCIVNTYT